MCSSAPTFRVQVRCGAFSFTLEAQKEAKGSICKAFYVLAWVVPWFHRTDTNPTVAWDPEHKTQWLFTATPTWHRPITTRIAICYSMYEPRRTSKHEHPYYQHHHHCHKPEQLTQTLTCRNLNPDMAYVLHHIYSYLTQGQQEEGLIAVSPLRNASSAKG